MEKLSAKTTRRVALAAQGFGSARRTIVNAGHLRRTVERLSLHQIDSVNVLVRAHYLPAFSRLGNYDRKLIDRAAWGPKRQRTLFEYWAHEASLLPFDLHPLLRWRMAEAERGDIGWKHLRAYARERRKEADAVLRRIEAEGPLSASDFENGRGQGGWWGWGEAKRSLEWLFWAGLITTATRKPSFERVYDLPERVIPPEVRSLPTPAPADAKRALIERSARALGVAAATDLRDYFRLDPQSASTAIDELVEEKTLIPVTVEGWRSPAYLHREARIPRRIHGQALLAPFDPLVWERSRAERLFDFRYRIEIYVPAEERVHGYYVLPFLLDERLVARVDLKADRQRSRLLVRRTTWEADVQPDARERLDCELTLIAKWLGLEAIDQ
jgi:uncharacterized protein YcaQ